MPLIFFPKFQQILPKSSSFSNFRFIFSTVPQFLTEILLSYSQISQIFFQRFTQSLDKVMVEIYPNTYSRLLARYLEY